MKKRLSYYLEYLLVRAAEALIRSISREASARWGERLGLLCSLFMLKRHRLIVANLERAFPEKRHGEIKKIARGVWKNLGRTAVEFVRMDEITSENYADFLEFEGEDVVRKAAAEDRGIIYIAFHLTNWELTGYATALHFGRVAAIARPIKNPLVDSWIQFKRRNAGLEIVVHRNAVRESLRLLKKKQSVAILVDQNLYQGGVFADFFGRPAATTTLPALLYERTQSPLVIGYSIRVGDKTKIIYEGPVNLPPVSDPKERILLYTQIINNEIEKVVRKYPANWFWIHNRWKRQPLETGAEGILEDALKNG